jgi:hypothetical protein
MRRSPKAGLEILHALPGELQRGRIAARMSTAAPMFSPLPTCAQCRQLCVVDLGHGRGTRSRGLQQSRFPALRMRELRHVCCSRPIGVTGRGTESIERKVREPPGVIRCKDLSIFGCTARSLLFAKLILQSHSQPFEGCSAVLDAGCFSQEHEREEAIGLEVLRFTVRESRQAPESSPIGCARITMKSLSECLCNEGGKPGGVGVIVLEPGLKVVRAGFDDGTWFIALCHHVENGILSQIVEYREAMLAGRADIDVRAAGIVGFEQREL